MRIRALFVAAVALSASLVSPASAETKRVYHIGNSLTDNIGYGGITRIAEQEGDVYKYGKQSSPGNPLDNHWAYKSITGQIYSQGPYGKYKDALKNYTWDVMTLQPFDNKQSGTTGDLQISKNFIDYAIKKSPNIQTYIYSRWPRRVSDGAGGYKPFDYTSLWTAPYTTSTSRTDKNNERKGFFEKLVKDLNKARPSLKKSVKMVPVGDVLAELDKRIKANQIDGLSDIEQLYSDAIHLNKTGGYVLGLTFYATMFKENPNGQTVPGAYGSIPKALAADIQDTVWDIVSTHPYAGVKSSTVPTSAVVPEPATLAMLMFAPLSLRRRR